MSAVFQTVNDSDGILIALKISVTSSNPTMGTVRH